MKVKKVVAKDIGTRLRFNLRTKIEEKWASLASQLCLKYDAA